MYWFCFGITVKKVPQFLLAVYNTCIYFNTFLCAQSCCLAHYFKYEMDFKQNVRCIVSSWFLGDNKRTFLFFLPRCPHCRIYTNFACGFTMLQSFQPQSFFFVQQHSKLFVSNEGFCFLGFFLTQNSY